MANVYILIDGAGSPPSGWSEIDAGYQDRMPLMGGALTTGGSDTHTHTGSATTNSVASNTSRHYSTSTPYALVGAHSHSCTLTSVGTPNHLPPHKNFRTFYRSVTGWDGKVPSGAIVFDPSVKTDWARVDSSDSYFIRLSGTAGGTGGSATPPGHTVAGNVSALAQSNIENGYGAGSTGATTTHNHGGYSDTTAAHSDPDWKYWSCGLVKSSAEVYLTSGCYLLFDGDPGAKWESQSVDGRYLKHNGPSPTATTGGANTTYEHGHTKDITSGACSAQVNTSTGSTFQTVFSHTHTITVTLDSATIQPAYVKLYLYKLLSGYGQCAAARVQLIGIW